MTKTKTTAVCDCNVIHQQAVKSASDRMLDSHMFAHIVELYKTIGDGTRIRILWALDYEELCVCDLSVLLDMTKSAVSHQLKVLKDANLVKFRKDGKNVFYSLGDEHVRQLIEVARDHIDCECR